MTRLIRVRSGKYHFYFDGKRIYVKMDGTLNQQYVVETFTYEKLNDHDYIHLVDAIYRKRITSTASFNDQLYSRFRLVPTAKRL